MLMLMLMLMLILILILMLVLVLVIVVEGEVGGRRSEGKHRTSNRNSVGVSSERTEDRERERGQNNS